MHFISTERETKTKMAGDRRYVEKHVNPIKMLESYPSNPGRVSKSLQSI